MKKETTKKEKVTKTPKAEKSVKSEKKSENKATLDAKVYNQAGKEIDSVKLPEDVFALPWNADLVHQVVVSLMSNKRVTLAHTKDRSEVSGGGKKPWQQKGLGRARHGSTRSPIWVKGGVAHGPRNEKNYERKINKKMKAKALFTILSKKFRDNEIFFVDSLSLTAPKTAEAVKVLESLSKMKGGEMILNKRKNSAYIAVTKKDTNLARGFSNVGNVFLDEFRNINPLDILNYRYLVIANPVESIEFLKAKLK